MNAFTMSRIFSASFRLYVARLKRVRASAGLMRAASTAALKASCSDGRHRQRAGLSNAHRFVGVHPATSFLCRGVRKSQCSHSPAQPRKHRDRCADDFGK